MDAWDPLWQSRTKQQDSNRQCSDQGDDNHRPQLLSFQLISQSHKLVSKPLKDNLVCIRWRMLHSGQRVIKKIEYGKKIQKTHIHGTKTYMPKNNQYNMREQV